MSKDTLIRDPLSDSSVALIVPGEAAESNELDGVPLGVSEADSDADGRGSVSISGRLSASEHPAKASVINTMDATAWRAKRENMVIFHHA